MRDRGRRSRLLDTIEKRKARIYESVVSIIGLMLWMVDVRCTKGGRNTIPETH